MAGFGGGSSKPSKFTKRTESGKATAKPKPGKKKPEPKEKTKPEPKAKNKKPDPRAKRSKTRESSIKAKKKQQKAEPQEIKEKIDVYQHLLKEVLDTNAPIESSSYYQLFAETIKEENINGMLMLENNNRYIEDITQMIRNLEYNERHDLVDDFDVYENSEGERNETKRKGHINIV